MMLGEEKNAVVFLRFACGFSADPNIASVASSLFFDTYLSSSSDCKYTILENIDLALRLQAPTPLADSGEQDDHLRLHPLKICLLLVRTIHHEKTPERRTGNGSEAAAALKAKLDDIWRVMSDVFDTLAISDGPGDTQPMRKNQRTDAYGHGEETPSSLLVYPAEETEQATQCLTEIRSLEGLAIPTDSEASKERLCAWAEEFTDTDFHFSDSLIAALAAVVPGSANVFPRVRRLTILQTRTRLSSDGAVPEASTVANNQAKAIALDLGTA